MGSNEVREAISDLADQVIDAIDRFRTSSKNEATEYRESNNISQCTKQDPSDKSPGFIELMAETEDAMPQLDATFRSFTRVMNEITEVTKTATSEVESVDETGKPSAGRLAAIYRLSKRLDGPAEEMESLADQYLDLLTRISGGMNALIARVPRLQDEQQIQAANELGNTLVNVAQSVGGGLDSLKGFRQSLINNYQLSSTLRPVLRRLSATVQKIMVSSEEFNKWRDDLSAALEDKDT